MNPGRLIKKTVTTTEETYADGSDLKDADLEGVTVEELDDTDDDDEPAAPSRRHRR